tara:strand:- start:810 stop:1124 length:315 start_codon:yes stop_codon:yes gene_type:complete
MAKDKIDFHTFNIDDKWLKMILNGEKKSEIRQYCLPLEGKKVGLMSNSTDRIEAIITIGIILDLRDLEEDDKELLLSEAKVDNEFRKYYPCNYLYQIKQVERVH